jgi:iron complex outermembrane recepter protein
MRSSHTKRFAAACSVIALAIPGTAYAQNADDQSEYEDKPIVVTAQGRLQELADVPLAVSAVSAEQLANTGANDIRQLNQVAPSLLVSSTGSEANGSARIRGIGTVGDNPGLESSVAVFIDGVYRSRSGIGLNELGEIERVELLRGPQGTLGGRNASAGMISITSKAPEFEFGGTAELTYGNYDFWRASGSVTGPLSETIAARIDGVYVKRDGFYNDTNNNTKVNDRDRFFVRGQIAFEPSDNLRFRLIGDYTKREEACCAAVYVNNTFNPSIGNLNEVASPIVAGGVINPNGNNIINVLRDLGQPVTAYDNMFSRNIYTTPGRSFAGKTTDGGVSLQMDYEMGGTTLTSITGYRSYASAQGSDTDYSTVDILYRAPGGSERKFKTFTQELRLQGEAFGGKLDWLIGGFFSDETLTLTDNLRFGDQYGRFATCRLVSGIASIAPLYSPTSAGCLAARPAAFGAASPLIYAGFDRLDAMNDVGATSDYYKQNSRNFALFTHNIFAITDTVDLTVGLRYTNERKKFNATFGNDNTVCGAQQAALSGLLTSPLGALAGGLIGLSCQGNSTAELNNVSINDKRSESEFTGTAVLSWKPTEDLLLYGSYSRGYKAGGFNLDRSALKSPIATFASVGGAQALVGRLQFDSELVTAYELGAKLDLPGFTLSAALFRQDFENFQLNTFDGAVFIVQTTNGCSTDLAGADRDASAATGSCAPGDITWGVRSEGVELEASLRPARNFVVGMGITYSNTRYNDNLVGNASGAPLNPALRKLPGDNLSNAPELVATGSVAWTPDIGSSGMSGLFYLDTRMTGGFNTGSDLFPQKEQPGYTIVNGRIGLRGPDSNWAIEGWVQNMFNVQYTQVAFNTPFQAGGAGAAFSDPGFPGGRQIFSAFLAEPRTYGLTLRGKF